ncbi:hypothetical protein BJV78DRAFT_1363231 [Lactifluus subvellereus]|nr:hypothetical protein BJV78DRAFT_1363231 [Lactifluus subvellereus]
MRNDATEAALGLLNLADAATNSTVPSKRAAPQDDEQPHASTSDTITCICGYSFDDGFSIACDDCSRWCHAACFGIVQGGVPEEWRCWVCDPRPVDRERAVRLQTQRMQDAIRAENEKRRRQTSPIVDRKHRRQGALAIDGPSSRRKRRASVNVQPTGEDEHVNVDEPWMHSYNPISRDIVPHQEVRDNLRRQAKHWRGVSALSPPGPLDNSPVLLSTSPSPSQTSIRPLPHSSFTHPILSSHTNPSVLPPSYAIHTTQPIPSSKFITPYTSTIIPSSAYLSDPLNAYAHHGMPKPFVHLFGPPLDVALDARITGNEARFVRSGCRPNAVLRPMICPRAKGNDERGQSSKSADSEMLTFGVFALRDIKANEEVVLGWEWDDGNTVHHLPALIETPHLFEAHHLSYIRNQMASMLHALSSTFTTCACGSKAKSCALNLMAEFVDGRLPTPTAPLSQRPNDSSEEDKRPHNRIDLGPLIGAQRGFHTREKSPLNGGMNGVEMISYPSVRLGATVDASTPLMSKGYQLLPNQSEKDHTQDVTDTPITPDLSPSSRDHDLRDTVGIQMYRSPSPSDSDPQPQSEDEEQMPPKMRKRWIHRSTEGLNAASPIPSPSGSNVSLASVLDEGQIELGSSDAKDMPPPPMPANLDPTTVLSIPPPSSPRIFTGKLSSFPSLPTAQLPDPQALSSPSTPFANLSLLSPTVSHSSNSSPLSPKLSILTSSFLSINSTSSPDADSRGPTQMDVDKDACNSSQIQHTPLQTTRSPSPQTLTSSEPLRRVPSPVQSGVVSPCSASAPPQSPAFPEPVVDAEPPPAQSPPCTPTAPAPPAPKVKMSLKDFAMRKKKQREEELARAAALPPDCESGSRQPAGVATSNSPVEATCNPCGSDGDVATSRVPTESVGAIDCVADPVTSPEPAALVESESSLYNFARTNGVHFTTSLSSTRAELVHAIPIGKESQLQDDIGVMKGSTPMSNGDTGTHPGVSPHSSRTPSPSLTDSEDGETGVSTTRGAPPTQPRSFAANAAPSLSSNSLPHRLPPSSTYRPGSSYVPPSIPASVRPLPSGPRALRAGMGGFASQPAAPFAPVRGFPASQFAGVPRGPSADRDRDRGWAGVTRGRGRGTASSWGR